MIGLKISWGDETDDSDDFAVDSPKTKHKKLENNPSEWAGFDDLPRRNRAGSGGQDEIISNVIFL